MLICIATFPVIIFTLYLILEFFQDFSNEDNLATSPLSHLLEEDTLRSDDSFDDEFCRGFNIDDDYISEEVS